MGPFLAQETAEAASLPHIHPIVVLGGDINARLRDDWDYESGTCWPDA